MRKLSIFITILLSFAGRSFSQAGLPTEFHIDSIPEGGVLFDKGWLYQEGNDTSSNWNPIEPTVDLYSLPKLRKDSIGWLRLAFTVDSSLLNKPYIFKIYQSIASEVYLNGSLITRYGRIGDFQLGTVAYRPGFEPLPILFTERHQVLTVRFAIEGRLPYTNGTHPYYLFRFRLLKTQTDSGFEEISHKYPLLNTFWAGIFLTISIIHLGIFLRFRTRKADLYFSLAMISIGIANILFLVLSRGERTIKFIAFGFAIDWILLIPAYNYLLYLAIRQLFPFKIKVLHFFIVAVFLLDVFFFLTSSYELGNLFSLQSSFLFSIITCISLAFRSYNNGKKESLIILVGFLIYFLINFCFLLFFGGLLKDVELGILGHFSVTDLLYFVSAISVPFCLSLYLSMDFAKTSHSLEKRLQEVQVLSEKNINYEREKQDILSRQNELLESEVNKRTAELQKSLDTLRTTQAQLVQSEKMASLGELTAGIAHEIQNPLNFVNNFSDVNTELIDEATLALNAGKPDETKELLTSLRENEEKIKHHGQRADAIVKSMLQHSRTSAGIKEPTDINTLADEYLRLAYHGLRAKDKIFNATLQTDFDQEIGKINVISQEIGRVLLNLFNNAFYAVAEKKKMNVVGYEPSVTLSTRRIGNQVEIRVKDNGSGIPERLREKIFQPFFTTKPTGQGTGLGLSLSYDIIKAHGGELILESVKGEGAEFILQLPV